MGTSLWEQKPFQACNFPPPVLPPGLRKQAAHGAMLPGDPDAGLACHTRGHLSLPTPPPQLTPTQGREPASELETTFPPCSPCLGGSPTSSDAKYGREAGAWEAGFKPRMVPKACMSAGERRKFQ